jgi:hypothetical protein
MVTYSPAIQHPPLRDEAGSLEARLFPGSESGIELLYPSRLVSPGAWIGHMPFAFWLVETLRPDVVVELGVHSGNSYCAFLQGIQHLSLTAQCYGVDHWRGDAHSHRYGEEVFEELSAYHDPLYGSFSTLVRATFDDARPYFSDQSVDLLHIDGFHTYEAAAHDFSSWLPKMSSRGVVLLHDIYVRERDFGVWQLWEELTARYHSLSFVHSHGLGVVYVGTEPPPAALRTLLSLEEPDDLARVRAYFGRLGMSLVDRFARRQAEEIARGVTAGERTLAEELRREVEAAQAELARQSDLAAGLQRELLAARAEVTRQTDASAALQQHRIEARAEAARQSEAAAKLRQELSACRDEMKRQSEAYAALRQEHSAATAEAARHGAAKEALQREVEASRAEAEHREQAASERLEQVKGELQAARAEAARHLDAARHSQAKAEQLTTQLTETLAQRERATQMLRQQIMATAGLQRELTSLRQCERGTDSPVDR